MVGKSTHKPSTWGEYQRHKMSRIPWESSKDFPGSFLSIPYSSYHLHRCIHSSCHGQSSSTTGDEMKWIFIHSRRTFHSKSSSTAFHSFRWTAHYFIVHGNYFIEYFIASRWSFHSLMATYSFNISFPHGNQFIHHFILPGNYFIEYFIASWWSFHSLMATYSFIISFSHGNQFIHHFILPDNYFIASWWSFHSLMATYSFTISFPHGNQFIHHFILPGNYFIQYFIPSWQPTHSIFHSLMATYSLRFHSPWQLFHSIFHLSQPIFQ